MTEEKKKKNEEIYNEIDYIYQIDFHECIDHYLHNNDKMLCHYIKDFNCYKINL